MIRAALLWALSLFEDSAGEIPTADNRHERRARASIARRVSGHGRRS